MKRNIRMHSGWRKVIEKPAELVIQAENQRVGRIKGNREGLLGEHRKCACSEIDRINDAVVSKCSLWLHFKTGEIRPLFSIEERSFKASMKGELFITMGSLHNKLSLRQLFEKQGGRVGEGGEDEAKMKNE
ncbi:hypothetical protein CEXT_542421 [Caerostris extrusa]|uniref:Uncharacterized protein n=1 Tax=Caerostris extrusa TaxID=172846 RepID=A0AAV4NKP7_CAEEX|nr:hypothetical protein CEXT_542421 [Caerostris extrusa]